jgi:hypothetical protein
MKTVFVLLAGIVLALPVFAQTYVPPTVDKNGVYRQGHYRSAPDQYRFNNYNAKNSVYGSNPYTGKQGYQRDEFSNPPAYNKSYGNPSRGGKSKR